MDHRNRPPSRDDAPSPERRKKSPPGPPMTLGNAAAARVQLIVWCKACGHRAEPDPAEIAQPRQPFPSGAIGCCARTAAATYRAGRDRDRAGIALTSPLLSKSPSRQLSTLCEPLGGPVVANRWATILWQNRVHASQLREHEAVWTLSNPTLRLGAKVRGSRCPNPRQCGHSRTDRVPRSTVRKVCRRPNPLVAGRPN
jgi:hypothetical protein